MPLSTGVCFFSTNPLPVFDCHAILQRIRPRRASSRLPWPRRKRLSPRPVAVRCRPSPPAYKTCGWSLPICRPDTPEPFVRRPTHSHRIHRQRQRHTVTVHAARRPPQSHFAPPSRLVLLLRSRRLARSNSPPLKHPRRHEEGCAEAGRERRPAQGQGAEGRLRSPRHRLAGRGHEGPEDDHSGHRRPRRGRQQAAQALPRRADRLRRPCQGGEEGRQEGRRRRQEGRRRGQEERGRRQ